MKTLNIEPLTAESFKSFGDVIETLPKPSFTINDGMADRHHALATVQTDSEGEAIISLIHSRQYNLPFYISMVERHPLGSQAFIPLNDTPFIVVVAPQGENVSSEAVIAFKTNGQQGVNYHAGVWHGLLATPFGETTFVCVDRAGEGNNCEEIHFPEHEILLLDI